MRIKTIFRPSALVCWALVGLFGFTGLGFIVLNIEPWTPIGRFLGSDIQSFGFWARIPRLGPFIMGNFVIAMSAALWAVTQTTEIVPAIFDLAIPMGSAEPAFVSLLRRWRIYAYCLEGFAAINRYAIYGNGFEDLWVDRFAWSLYEFNYEQIITIIVTLFTVETIVVAIAVLVVIATGRTPAMITKTARRWKNRRKNRATRKPKTQPTTHPDSQSWQQH